MSRMMGGAYGAGGSSSSSRRSTTAAAPEQPSEILASRRRLNLVMQQLHMGATGSGSSGMPARQSGGILASAGVNGKPEIEAWVSSMQPVLDAINDAAIDVRATTSGNSFVLTDQTGSTTSNLRVEQLGAEETAADLGLWGVNTASDSVTGLELDLVAGVTALRGASLTELAGGSGVGPLTNLDITLSDGSSASICPSLVRVQMV